MDETTMSLIIHGCKLAGDLESNLPNLSGQPDVLSRSCEEIANVFKTAMDRLNANNPSSSSYVPMEAAAAQALTGSYFDAAVQEWWKSNYTRALGLVQSQLSSSTDKIQFSGKTDGMDTLMELGSGVKIPELGAKDMDYSLGARSSAESAGKSPAVGTTPRSRKRKEGVDVHTKRVPVHRMGNTEIPPEDGFTWRKYGQKEILGSNFPRGYYRCTHKNFFGCEAKKYVQRLDEDPNTYEVTYYGNHTCHMSSTGPSADGEQDQQRLQMLLQPVLPPPPSSSTTCPLSIWLARGLEDMNEKGTNNPMDLQLQMYPDIHLGDQSDQCSMAAAHHQGTSSSPQQETREAELCPVVEFADAMFNSGSSTSSNVMDSIFPSVQDK